jgi:hypothetical protein
MIREKIERNGLVIISIGAAVVYWHFDSLHPGELITRIFTAFFFVAYGIFTQYLINTRNAMAIELEKAHNRLTEQVTQFADSTRPKQEIDVIKWEE